MIGGGLYGPRVAVLDELRAPILDRLTGIARKITTLHSRRYGTTTDIMRRMLAEQSRNDRLSYARYVKLTALDATPPSRSAGKGSVSHDRTTGGKTPPYGNDASGGGPPHDGTRGGGEHPGDFVVTLSNGCRLQGRVEGPPDGFPVFQFHGMPGSRVDTAPPELLETLGIRLITFDRPGYGGSDHYDMNFADAAEHVKAIADHFGIEKFAIVGRSGGTPYAAAAAAGLPDRVTRLGLLVPFAPPEVMQARFRTNMSQQADTDLSFEELSTKRLASFQDSNDPLAIIGIPRENLSEKDLAIIEKNYGLLQEMHGEGLRNGTAGWNGDMHRILGGQPWGFDVGDVKCPTLIWSASGDGFTPPEHAQGLASLLPPEQCRLYTVHGGEVGHFGAMEIKPGTYAWLAEKEDMALFPTTPPPGHPPGTPIPTTLEQWTSLAA